jgi:hypothetical protein
MKTKKRGTMKMLPTKKISMSMWAGVCAVSFVLSVASAFAGSKDDGNKAGPTQPISLEEFKGRCMHPRDYDKQVAPENISISCTNVESEFVPEAPGNFQMMSARQVTAGVFSSKWHVGGVDAKDVPVQQKSGSCLRYKEVVRTLTEARQVSCDEIVAMKGDIQDYCLSVLDSSKSQHPKLIDTKETGRLIDTCGGIQVTNNGSGKGSMY